MTLRIVLRFSVGLTKSSRVSSTLEAFAVWVRMDSNHRSRRQQIYSLPHLATLEHTLISMFTRESQFSIFNFQFSIRFEPLVGLEPTTAGLQI